MSFYSYSIYSSSSEPNYLQLLTFTPLGMDLSLKWNVTFIMGYVDSM